MVQTTKVPARATAAEVAAKLAHVHQQKHTLEWVGATQCQLDACASVNWQGRERWNNNYSMMLLLSTLGVSEECMLCCRPLK